MKRVVPVKYLQISVLFERNSKIALKIRLARPLNTIFLESYFEKFKKYCQKFATF
jgi:hypothetical protein